MNLPPIAKTYGGRRVLDLPALELADGAIHAVIGANGSGKSTLARILAGVINRIRGASGRTGRIYAPAVLLLPDERGTQPALTGAGRERAMAQLETLVWPGWPGRMPRASPAGRRPDWRWPGC